MVDDVVTLRKNRLASMFSHPVGRATLLRLVSLAAGILGSVIVARLGGPEVKGIASSFAASNAIIFMTINFDLAQQTLRNGRSSNDLGRVFPLLYRAWSVYLLSGTAVVASLAALGLPGGWLAIGTIAFLLGTQAALAGTGFAGPVVAAWGAVVQQLALMAGTIAFWHFGSLNEDSIRWAIVISYLAPIAVFAPYMIRSEAPKSPVRLRELAGLLHVGLPWQVSRFMQILMQKLDVIVVMLLVGSTAAGVYSVGLSLAMLCTIVASQYSNNALHQAFKGIPTRPGMNSLYAALSGLVLATGLLAVGSPAITALYGPEFSGAYLIMIVSLPGAVAYGVIQVQTNYIRILGSWKALALTSSVGLSVMAVGLVLMIGPVGAVGAGIAFSAGAVASAICGAFVLRSMTPSLPVPSSL